MRHLKAYAAILVFTLLVVVGGKLAFDRYKMYLPGLLAPPIAENRPVSWQPGPDAPATPAAQRPPNIVLIVADDLGWNDITLNDGGVVPTPHIDSIGKDGANFLTGYAGNATCAPSRAAMMTGRYPTRFGFEFTPVPVAFAKTIGGFPLNPGETLRPVYHAEREADVPPVEQMALPASEVTLASLLRDNGYRTLMIGKWHLGETKSNAAPTQRGFDEALGFTQGASLFAPLKDPAYVESRQDFDPIDRFLWANLKYHVRKDDGAPFKPRGYLTDYFGDEASAAITANRHRPFFLYLAYNAPHTPLQATKADYDALAAIPDHRARVYAAMVRALDRSVGSVLQSLKANGLEDNTIVIFTSDNGAPNYIGLPGVNAPYRGWKATFFEGGVRTPFLVRWPARVKAGTTFAYPVTHFDIFTTVSAAAGAVLPAGRAYDGVDLVPYLNATVAERPHQTLFWRSGEYKVVRDGDWKLQVTTRPDKVWLFNLDADPTERSNLAASNPAKVAELRALLAAHDREQAPPLWPALLEAPVAIDRTLAQPPKPGEEYIYWAN